MRCLTAMAVFLFALQARAAETEFTIPNPLKQRWPQELVHVDVPAGRVADQMIVRMGGDVRPAQAESWQATGQSAADAPTTRIWFLATLDKKQKEQTVTLAPGTAPSPLNLQQRDGWLIVENGVYHYRLPNFSDRQGPRKLSELRPILGGAAPAAGGEFHGAGTFHGDLTVHQARTVVLEQGPVFIKVLVTLHFVPPPARQVNEKPVAPLERYHAQLRFVAGDPWIQVHERYHLPEPAAYTFVLGEKMDADTAMWIRWFGWKGFGGNTHQHYLPLRPQKDQRGPFTRLQPRWVQRPGMSQEFFATRGGHPPYYNRKKKKRIENPDYAPDAPAFGIVATHASRWAQPYDQLINCHAENGDTARFEFPLYRGARSYAICAGPRKLFDSTGKIESLIRRRSEWTLDEVWHDYILEWPRKPELAGPHILITAERLERLQEDYREGRDTPAMQVVRRYEDKELKKDAQRLMQLIKGEKPRGGGRAPGAGLWLGRRYQNDFLNPTTATRRLSPGLVTADLTCGGKPIGGPSTAALGYVFTDLDQWPGWHNGWHPGNPNFHTDKYLVAINTAAAILDHPHAQRWLDFGLRNWKEDIARTLLAPDGVGYECPGYSTYSLTLQLELARIFQNVGQGNLVAANPLFKQTGRWHRHLLTPRDRRIGIRHQAPIGDTHRWGLHDGVAFGMLAKFHADADPAFAREMQGILQMFRDQGMETGFIEDLIEMDPSIEPMPLSEMDWGSGFFYGFGSIMRSRFGTEKETFVSMKAGPRRGHYHNDELSYHFYGAGEPVSLDYNCSYGPRGDHAALHNSMTFGRSGTISHKGRNDRVPAQEQMHGMARTALFRTTPAADLVVAERTGNTLVMSATYPQDAIYGYGYPRREVPPITHRRMLMLIKHPDGNPLNDYLVVRDEADSLEPQQVNIHLLAREVDGELPLLRATGQYDTDSTLFIAHAEEPELQLGRWYYGKGRVTDELTITREEIERTDGRALIPPEGWDGRWSIGEYQKWVRLETRPGSSVLWVLYPRRRGEPEPTFEALAGGRGVRVTLGEHTDEIHAASQWPAGSKRLGDVLVMQDGKATVLVRAGALPPGRVPAGPLDENGNKVTDAPAARPVFGTRTSETEGE